MKIKYLLLSASMFLFACQKELELNPQQSLPDQIVFNSPATAISALNGVYSTAQTFDFYGNLPQVIGEYMGTNVNYVGTFTTLQDLNTFTAVSTNSNVSGIWQVHYQVITRANQVIAKIGGVDGISDQLKTQYIGT
jgi:hypothetical protein